MGGSVAARRSELGGLAIDIDLPRAQLPAELAATQHRMTRPPPDATGPTVLVVEDDAETRAALVRELSGRGYRVEEAADGRSALQRWELRRPTSSCSTWACPISTASRSSSASGRRRRRRS